MTDLTSNPSTGRSRRQGKFWPHGALCLGLAAALLFGSGALAAANKAKPKQTGYIAFAKLSNKEGVLPQKRCREYGGRPVGGQEQSLVTRSGRTDKWFYNVLWFGQHQYVTYKRDNSESIAGKVGLQSYVIALCQF